MQGKYSVLIISTFVLQLVLSQKIAPPAYSTDLETALRNELFITNSYEVLQRPQQKVHITVSLTILTVNDLNIKDQKLSLSGYFDLKWADSRLMWSNTALTSQDFTSVPFLFSTETYVWTPTLIIENSVDDIDVISNKKIPMRIGQHGLVNWNPSGIYKISCESDTTYYPLDKQECTLKLSSWAYTSNEVGLLFDNTPVDLDFYSENGEWELTGATASESGDKSKKGVSFASLTFTISLQRRPMFHILNTIFPVALMALLTAMVFKLPVDSGEKIGFSLTVLLAYAVYLTLISAEIPSTSVTVCYLSLYLAFILSLGAISVCLTIFVLSLHFHPADEKVPRWLNKLTSVVLTRLACTKLPFTCRRKNKTGSMERITPVTKIDLKSRKDDGPVIIDTGDTDDDYDDEEFSWQQLSNIIDKIFFNVYILLITTSTVSLFLVITSKYD